MDNFLSYPFESSLKPSPGAESVLASHVTDGVTLVQHTGSQQHSDQS